MQKVILILTRFLHKVIYIDAFSAQSYSQIDAFLHSVAQELNFEPNFSLEGAWIWKFQAQIHVQGG